MFKSGTTCTLIRISSRRNEINTDASQVEIGAVLTQQDKDGSQLVTIISRGLTEAESRYHANEL